MKKNAFKRLSKSSHILIIPYITGRGNLTESQKENKTHTHNENIVLSYAQYQG